MWSGWHMWSAWSVTAMIGLAALLILGWLSVRHALRGSGGARRCFELMGVALVLLVVSATQVHRSRPLMTFRFLSTPAVGSGETGKGAVLVTLPDRTTMLIDSRQDDAAYGREEGLPGAHGGAAGPDEAGADYVVLTRAGLIGTPRSGQLASIAPPNGSQSLIASGPGFAVRLVGASPGSPGETLRDRPLTVSLTFGKETFIVTETTVIAGTATYSAASHGQAIICTDGESVWVEQSR